MTLESLSSKEVIDGFIIVGAMYDASTGRVRVPCNHSPQWVYRLASVVGSDRKLTETNESVVGRDFYVNADMDDYSKENEYEWLKNDMSVVSFEINTGALYRYAEWWSNDFHCPDTFAITPTVAALVYNECGHDMEGGIMEMEVRRAPGFKQAMLDAGFDVEGFDGKWRLDADTAEEFRQYSQTGPVYYE